ncbi:hypothetical protein Gura_3444 [Geotalea uraniireducens Rf4]|uniref:Uncharacterized protein n=1 Tax=Geotalea uraniireducens (strain Rf4) TaxID=351605 RepID=A5G732_GEOUR|nr:hypothetical protein Gura_3444 [Geotalea uraniireducens Rf4]
MRKIRCGVIVLWMLLCCSVTSVSAQVSIGIGLPNVSIGINLPLFPELVPVPGYPVYYAPRVAANYFFYDGMYWVYQDDEWYASYWYNGPWWFVEPEVLPLFILRIPVRYYRHPPVYFRGWRSNAPPRWGEHWGREWEQHRRGWDRWKRGSAPPRAPLPVYQRRYSRDRYPRVEQQQTLRRQHYRYQPRDKEVRRHFQQRGEQRAPAPAQRRRQEEPRMRGPGQQEIQRPTEPRQQRGPAFRERREQPGGVQREQQEPRQQGREQRVRDRERSQEPRPQGREQRLKERERSQEPDRGQGERQRKEEDRGRERNN